MEEGILEKPIIVRKPIHPEEFSNNAWTLLLHRIHDEKIIIGQWARKFAFRHSSDLPSTRLCVLFPSC